MRKSPCGARALGAVAAFLASMGVAAIAGAQPLAPPTPMGPNVAPPQTEEEQKRQETLETLDRARFEDSGRPASFVYVTAGGGGGYVDLTAFHQDQAGVPSPKNGGGVVNLAAGVRFVVLTVGARARFMATPGFTLWQVMAEGAYHVPMSSFDPWFGVHGGYAFTGSVDTSTITSAPADALKGLSLGGFVGGADVGGDYYLSPLVSVGAAATFDVLVLQRGALTPGPSGAPVTDASLAKPGSATGFAATGALRVGLHF